MKKERMALPAVGGSSLLVIFAVLCLTVFALLSLSTARADRRMADTAADAVSEFYAAELEAQKIYARLQAGEEVDGVAVEDDLYRYSCPLSEEQVLEVEVRKDGEKWSICCWQVVARGAAVSETLPVWNGEKEE